VTQAVCVNCKGRHSATSSKYQEVSRILKVAATDKVSYLDALIKGKVWCRCIAASGRRWDRCCCCCWSEDLYNASNCSSVDNETSFGAQAATSETWAVPEDLRQQSQPGTTRLHQQPCQQQTTPKTGVPTFLLKITVILYTLDILRDKKRAYDFNYVAYSINELASIVFGNHAGNPCLTPDCPESKD